MVAFERREAEAEKRGIAPWSLPLAVCVDVLAWAPSNPWGFNLGGLAPKLATVDRDEAQPIRPAKSRTIGPAQEVDQADPILLQLSLVTVRAGGSLDLEIGATPAATTADAASATIAGSLPRIDATMTELQWLIATSTFGAGIGGVIATGRLGTVVGGAAGYIWGARRWKSRK